jgi:hypothetical protein
MQGSRTSLGISSDTLERLNKYKPDGVTHDTYLNALMDEMGKAKVTLSFEEK